MQYQLNITSTFLRFGYILRVANLNYLANSMSMKKNKGYDTKVSYDTATALVSTENLKATYLGILNISVH